MSKLFKARKARTAGLITITALTLAGLGAIPASALSNGTDVPNNENPNVVKVATGYGTCTGALIDPSWVATVASCFSQNPANFSQLKAGKPALPAKVLFGVDAASRDNTGIAVEDLQPYTGADGRDLALIKLSSPAINTTPFKLATTAPAVDEKLDFIGWGRTKTEWVPAVSHKASFNTTAVNAKEITVVGNNPVDASLCLGDSGAPAIRTTAEGQEILALNSRSWQKNCIGSTQTQDGAFASRIDDITPWIQTTITNANKLPGVASGAIIQFKNNGIANACLGLPNFTSAQNVQQQATVCGQTTRQWWEVTEVSPAVYELKGEFAKLCLGAVSNSTIEFATVGQVTCQPGNKFQQWKTVSVGGDKYLLQNVGSGFYIDANGVTQGTDEKLSLRTLSNRTKQQWTVSVFTQANYDLAPIGSFKSIQAVAPAASAGSSVRHINGEGQIAKVTSASAATLRQDASWKIVKGLADPKCYSFESLNFPGKYLTANVSTAKVALTVPANPTDAAATWCARTGKVGVNTVQLQWYANPTRVLRHNSGLLYAGTSGGSISGADSPTTFNEMTSWSIGETWATPAP
ncbi:AbfB domain-containing protein [Psychromicrobium sp. YIM B11713]|uniref:AbfB domain-containing protein n=1 Tax=Psychromicrobium sp. YIM B11713 TaxID=3145233 RepID=UPI00374F7431